MTENTQTTERPFDPPVSMEQVTEQRRTLYANGTITPLLDLMREGVIIINSSRQIVYANAAVLELAGAASEDDLLGLVPGLALQCVHALEESQSCGFTRFCAICGSMFSIMSGLNKEARRHDFSLTRMVDGRTESLDLDIFAWPLDVDGAPYYFLGVTDVSHEKRRAALERIFFHDILNIAGGLRGMAALLIEDDDVPDKDETLQMFHLYADYLVQEIEAQRILRAAERKDLEVGRETIHARILLGEIRQIYQHHHVGKDKEIALESVSPTIAFESDKNLVGRVIGNMVKNALEASAPGERVTMGCVDLGESVEFQVHNPGTIPQEDQLQIFNRSFSTKGAGRGLGTYGMKLLSEQYLKGRVSFSSGPEGTTFRAVYPKRP